MRQDQLLWQETRYQIRKEELDIPGKGGAIRVGEQCYVTGWYSKLNSRGEEEGDDESRQSDEANSPAEGDNRSIQTPLWKISCQNIKREIIT